MKILVILLGLFFSFSSIHFCVSSSFVEKSSEGCNWTDQYASTGDNIEYSDLGLWNSLKFSLPEETARMEITGALHGNQVFEHFTFA